MTTQVDTSLAGRRAPARALERGRDWMRYLVPVARALYVAIFLAAVPGHFSAGTIAYAAQHGVPLPSIAVPAAGILSGLGALSVLFGFHARIGAWLLVVFLVPVTLTMHAFWAVADPAMASIQQIMFLKNLSMLGAALLVAYFGAGPLSFDARARSGEPAPAARE